MQHNVMIWSEQMNHCAKVKFHDWYDWYRRKTQKAENWQLWRHIWGSTLGSKYVFLCVTVCLCFLMSFWCGIIQMVEKFFIVFFTAPTTFSSGSLLCRSSHLLHLADMSLNVFVWNMWGIRSFVAFLDSLLVLRCSCINWFRFVAFMQ